MQEQKFVGSTGLRTCNSSWLQRDCARKQLTDPRAKKCMQNDSDDGHGIRRMVEGEEKEKEKDDDDDDDDEGRVHVVSSSMRPAVAMSARRAAKNSTEEARQQEQAKQQQVLS
jgi:hypothetical protein